MNRHERRASVARQREGGRTMFLFFRKGPNDETFFYPVEIPADQLDENIRLNPGTLRVEDIAGNVVWSAETTVHRP